MRTALFIDFDNVYSGLSRTAPAFADAFARAPVRWLDWLTDALPLPVTAPAAGPRQVLVRRCYMNPEPYQRYRQGFSRAGFEVTDCPPMTTAGKTSTDMHMVLDMVDVLNASTHFDEFMVFSADCDFTPVLRKLRREDRRTAVFAAGATAACYRASADLVIEPEAFIRDALGCERPTLAEAAAPIATALDDMQRRVQQAILDEVLASPKPVPVARLAQTLRAAFPALEQRWLGHGSCKRMLDSLQLPSIQIVWHRQNGYAMDTQRHRFEPTPTGELGAGRSGAGYGLSVVPFAGPGAGGAGSAQLAIAAHSPRAAA